MTVTLPDIKWQNKTSNKPIYCISMTAVTVNDLRILLLDNANKR